MADKDIRSGDDWQDTGSSIRSDQRWVSKVPVDDLKPETKGVRTSIPIQTDGGVHLVDANGRPMAMRSEISRTDDEIALAWKRKQEMEPCWMCKHFKRGKFTPDQKRKFLQALIKEHGWTEDMVRGEMGDIDKFEYCPVYELLTHENASCPDHWVKRDDL